ncbi:MAG TPA: ATP-binding protein [Planctomycetaceae bacterium]|nr:ATP-binding protein [Planctomycetaceae bacterium]
MFRSTRPISVTRRLIEQYFMFGLACLFFCVAVCVVLAWRGSLTSLVPAAVVLPLAILLVGGLVLRRSLGLVATIEEQLGRIAAVSSPVEHDLRPIAASDPLADGWNALLERFAGQASLGDLEARLSRALGGFHEQRFEQVFNTLSDGVAVTDAAGVIRFGNRSLAAVLRLPGGESVEGRDLYELLEREGSPDGCGERLRRQSGPAPMSIPCGPNLEDGVLRVSRAPLAGDGAEAGTLVWTVRDVTQQKLADEMRSQFVFTATHELRTPLANIRAYAETLSLEEGIDVEKQKEFCNIINAEATRLGRFVDELLNISQMEAGALTLARHETDVERLLSEVIEHVQPQMRQKGMDFEPLLPPKLPKLQIDKDKVAAALVNLLGNAVKYTPDGGRVRLQVEASLEHVSFHVEDSGYGIAPDELPHVFDQFFRSGDARVRQTTGSGLGLAFTREVARLHGGRVGVHSELNKGSKFTMTLPVR